MKFFKFSIILFLITIAIFYPISTFLKNNINKELTKFIYLSHEFRQLDDTYALCLGLVKGNPTNNNIKSCNLILKKIISKKQQIKDECPYLSFYTKYLGSEPKY